jgi:transposase
LEYLVLGLRPGQGYPALALEIAKRLATRLAKTVESWCPAILVALTHNVSNGRTESFNG